jgi:hypothetical protein
VLAGILLGIGLIAAAPSGLGVLALDGQPGVADGAALGENLQLEVQARVGVQVTPGAELGSLIPLLGCEAADAPCLAEVSASLGVRWVIYGDAAPESGAVRVRVFLFDAAAKATVSSSERLLSSAGDRAGLGAAVSALLAAAPSGLLRPPPERRGA